MPSPTLREEELQESFARSSGPGGQHVNKVSTAVTLTHLPTGLSVTVSDSRSQSMNRSIARERIGAKIEELRLSRRQNARAAAAKARRRLARRSPSEKRKLVEGGNAAAPNSKTAADGSANKLFSLQFRFHSPAHGSPHLRSSRHQETPQR